MSTGSPKYRVSGNKQDEDPENNTNEDFEISENYDPNSPKPLDLSSPKRRVKEPMDPALHRLLTHVLNRAAADMAANQRNSRVRVRRFVPTMTLVENQHKSLIAIQDHLPYEDLWTCAFVCKSWRQATTKSFKKWQLLKLRLHFIWPSDLSVDPSKPQNTTPIPAKKMLPRLAIKIPTQMDENTDVSSKFFESTTLKNLKSKILKETKTVIWLILDLIHIPHYSTPLWDTVTDCFDLIRPHLSRLILDGTFEGWPFLSVNGEALTGPTNWMLLDSPNLRQVYFREILTCGMETNSKFVPNIPLPPPPVQLTGIKTVRFPKTAISDECQHLIEKISSVIPNIENLYNFPVHFLSLLSSGELDSDGLCYVTGEVLLKIKSISYDLNLTYNPQPKTEMESIHKRMEMTLMTAISTKVRLQTLVMKWSPRNGLVSIADWRDCAKTFSAILLSSRHTLKTLEIHNTSFAQYIKIPQMPSLLTLTLVGPVEGGIKFFRNFGMGFELNHKFPNLNRLEILNLHDNPNHLDMMLPPDIFCPPWLLRNHSPQQTVVVLSTVKELKIRDFAGNVSIKILNLLTMQFPHIEVLDVGESWQWIDDFLSSIWTLWPKLKVLSMEILWTNEDLKGKPRKCLDELITGIPEARCAELRKLRHKLPLDLARERKYSSMLDLKNLQLLSMSFLSTAIPLMSNVSLFYGFQFHPELQVILRSIKSK